MTPLIILAGLLVAMSAAMCVTFLLVIRRALDILAMPVTVESPRPAINQVEATFNPAPNVVTGALPDSITSALTQLRAYPTRAEEPEYFVDPFEYDISPDGPPMSLPLSGRSGWGDLP